MGEYFNFFSLNVGMSSTCAGLATLITAQHLDIIFLQEVRITSEQLCILVGNLGFQASVNIDPDQPSRPGTAIVWRKTLPVRDVFTLVMCRAQVTSLGPYMLLNVYAPSGSENKHARNEFFGQDIFRAFRLNSGASWILGGDFNCVLKAMDIENGIGFNQKLCMALRDLVSSHSLCDSFRHLHPRKEEFTFFRAGKAPSRLDRLYISRALAVGLAEAVHVASLSDHCGVQMRLLLSVELISLPKTQHRTYWKMNTAILGEEEFLPNFTPFWVRISRSRHFFSDLAEWWDKCAKPEIKDFCLGYSIHRKLKRDQTKKFLLSYLKIVLASKNWSEVARVKEELDQMLKSDAMGVVIRSRYKQNAEEEKASLFHAAREVRNDKNNVKSLKVNGKVIKDRMLIEEEVVNYFGALFNGHHNSDLENTGSPFVPDNTHLDELLHGLGVLSDADSENMHEDISMAY